MADTPRTPDHVVRRIAALGGVAPQTVRRYLSGKRVYGASKERIERGMAEDRRRQARRAEEDED